MVGLIVLKTLLIPLAVVFLAILVVSSYPVKGGAEPEAKGSVPAGGASGQGAAEPCRAGEQTGPRFSFSS
jgi:hypothetical protein